ncbi:MAG: hypothetical protein ACP5GO_04965 [Thermoprotei archaeon]
MAKIPVVFLEPPLGAVGFPGGPNIRYLDTQITPEVASWYETSWKWEDDLRKRVSSKLKLMYPNEEFSEYIIKSLDDLRAFLEKEREAIGYVVVDLQGPSVMLTEIVETGKPVILLAETLGGGGDYLLDRALFEKYPVVRIATRDVDSEAALSKVRYLIALYKLKSTVALVISNRDLSAWINRVYLNTGIKVIQMSGSEFVKNYYSKVKDDDAEPIARAWIEGAAQFPDKDKQYSEVLKSARLYVAMNNVLKDLGATAITVDCLGLRSVSSVVLDAWPCLGYAQMWKDGKYVPMCEADLNSLVVALVGKHLLGVNGSATDPVTDDLKGTVTYYHCYLPINPAAGTELRYSIVPSHLGTRYAAVYVEYPVGRKITAVGFNINDKKAYVHESEIVGNELSLPACGTKVIGKTDVSSLAKKWANGWHRVVLLGDHRQAISEFAKLMGFEVINEDSQVS